ncbi:YaiI/YqxD family protein [Motilimonas eburnea]|uniref:YaiI/YqxD family protein n=1 Tax=Motilimonas eburnea TaxID=1737488 RepID=UPI001E2BF196|nr:YaiI/YqxD family protein [Motilimonas eburnea]MCE2570320.1 YaiI/YqxD family protein [Motilimonas eburnea]
MNIWVDADACPVVIKEILFRAAQRVGVHTTLIANMSIPVPPSAYLHSVQVSSGFDVADQEIVKRCDAGDIVITSDIPLADEAISKGAHVLSPRGEVMTKDNIRQRLNMRDFMDTLRASGVQSGGPAPLGNRDKMNFANELDKLLTVYQRKQKAKGTK